LTSALKTPRLVLEPLAEHHADVMFGVLSDPTIYEHLDYEAPPSLEHLRDVYRKLAVGHSPDGQEGWLNWIVMHPQRGPIGVVQSTVMPAQRAAWVAYVLAQPHRGFGFAGEAAAAMVDHLIDALGVTTLLAMIEDANAPSRRLLVKLGFDPADADQQARWGRDMTPTERLFVRSVSVPERDVGLCDPRDRPFDTPAGRTPA
jgi:RimJ/RimL family protein N-acetyltransferase